ncbi:MAG TPA: type II toxin-antitoxin system CcdA family antitoxin [Candidatus Dormibacteraeota bacterium]|nr:type II toxin-antitoxin system CcdA family antitoxin [Candidatus Dormibacteraeota bacterium]
MPRVNVYLPDELASAARPLELNLSQLLQAAVAERLDSVRLDAWLRRLDAAGEPTLSHAETRKGLDAIDAERPRG